MAQHRKTLSSSPHLRCVAPDLSLLNEMPLGEPAKPWQPPRSRQAGVPVFSRLRILVAPLRSTLRCRRVATGAVPRIPAAPLGHASLNALHRSPLHRLEPDPERRGVASSQVRTRAPAHESSAVGEATAETPTSDDLRLNRHADRGVAGCTGHVRFSGKALDMVTTLVLRAPRAAAKRRRKPHPGKVRQRSRRRWSACCRTCPARRAGRLT